MKSFIRSSIAALLAIYCGHTANAQSTLAQVQASINANIKANGTGAITGPVLNTVLNLMALSTPTMIGTISGDCTGTLATLVCTKTNGVTLGYFATGTDAANLTGVVPTAQLTNVINAIGYTPGNVASPLSQFAATTSAQLRGVLSDETGTGAAVFAASPTFTGTPFAPTAAVDTSTTQLATTAYVINQGYAKLSGATFTGDVVLNANPTTNLQAATKAYVDSLSGTGLFVHPAVSVATTGALTTTYNNGAGTLTNAGALAAISIDGIALTSSTRVLVKDQTNQFENDAYTVTTVGSGAVAWVLTRATDFDVVGAGEIASGAYFLVNDGATYQNSGFVFSSTASPIVLGTTDLPFSVFSGTVAGYAPIASPVFTGSVTIPANGLILGTTQLVAASGNIGLGTASPDSPLHVVGTAHVGDSAATSFLLDLGSTGVGGTRSVYLSGDGTNISLVNQENGYFLLGTNNAERVRVTNIGYVGIATSSPAYLLDVAGQASVNQLILPNAGSNYISATAATGQLVFEVNGGTTGLVLSSVGRLTSASGHTIVGGANCQNQAIGVDACWTGTAGETYADYAFWSTNAYVDATRKYGTTVISEATATQPGNQTAFRADMNCQMTDAAKFCDGMEVVSTSKTGTTAGRFTAFNPYARVLSGTSVTSLVGIELNLGADGTVSSIREGLRIVDGLVGWSSGNQAPLMDAAIAIARDDTYGAGFKNGILFGDTAANTFGVSASGRLINVAGTPPILDVAFDLSGMTNGFNIGGIVMPDGATNSTIQWGTSATGTKISTNLVKALRFQTSTGAAFGGNQYSFNWTGSVLDLYVDGTRIGSVNVTP